MKPHLSERLLFAMLERGIENQEISKKIMDLAKKNNTSITEEQAYSIANIVNINNVEIYQEKPSELINLIISLHSNQKIKVGKIECNIFNNELKEVLLEHISKKYAHCFRRTYQRYYTTLHMPISDISQKIRDYDFDFLNNLRKEIEDALKKERTEKKNSNIIKSSAREICETLHCNYLDNIKGLEKKRYVSYMMYLFLLN